MYGNVRKVSVNMCMCSFALGVLLTAQELLIYVILHEIRSGAVRIVFTGFGTLVIKAQKYKKQKRDSISYTGSNDRKRKWRETRESPDEPMRKNPIQRKSSKKELKINPHHL